MRPCIVYQLNALTKYPLRRFQAGQDPRLAGTADVARTVHATVRYAASGPRYFPGRTKLYKSFTAYDGFDAR